MSTALVIGESLIDVVNDAGRVSEHPGGSPLNVAVGLARLGREVELATWIGLDAPGWNIESYVGADNIHLSGFSRGASRTSTAIATLDAGQARYQFDFHWALPSVEIPDGCTVVHTGSLACGITPGCDVALEAVADARDSATITFDPNCRPSLLGDPSTARRHLEQFVRLADVVKASDEDLEWLGEGADPVEILTGWMGLGPKIGILTMGEHGVVAMTAGGVEIRLPGERTEVVDTVGAGDSFMSATIDGLWTAGLLGAEHRTDLGHTEPVILRRVMQRATHIAAITVSRAGANPPRSSELQPQILRD
ncbi:carbohydrate kinase [Cutibacterium sp.]|uniref:carbohydrate kinase family protein n=1 Tax=Cutibacterium sp. TaxID=1912221 RepID=UPI0026DC34BF|nr:carbohydrate kinase [Cutibacterium sp.]MDO4412497.1 carbohydrate kinase [Cutibacterium sp.]